jgi:hypothetical protein
LLLAGKIRALKMPEPTPPSTDEGLR